MREETVANQPVSRLAEDDPIRHAADVLLARHTDILGDLADARLSELDIELLARWNLGNAAQRENIVVARQAVNRVYCGRRQDGVR
jgi:hypothetical protein